MPHRIAASREWFVTPTRSNAPAQPTDLGHAVAAALHAFEESSLETLCGLPVDGLYAFEGVFQHLARPAQCGSCRSAVRML